ncbi:MAG: 30S ribosomal protein S4 [Candidatus Micrarchaeia archaeon]|jgi:small subunit ribosomal protein S4
MGAPRRLRKKYEKPTMMWDRQRIEEEHALVEKYGLRNLKELWKASTELRRIRRNVRELFSGRASEEKGSQIISRLAKYGIVKPDATLDDLLILTPEAFLERRLQTVVFKKGLAKTIKQARQLITHGFIAINGRKITIPSYMVKPEEEKGIGYYKPFNIEHNILSSAPRSAQSESREEGSEAVEEKGDAA